MATIIDGKKLAAALNAATAKEVAALCAKGLTPGLAFILVGENPASQVYVRNKEKACEQVGIHSVLEKLPGDVPEKTLLRLIESLNKNSKVHGILVQLPLPKNLNADKILEAVFPEKDVDGLHPENMGRLMLGLPCLAPCTAQGVVAMIESVAKNLAGKEVCVVGRSAIVGKPTAALLTQRNATVTLCHSQTKNLPEKIAAADIVVAAIGRPRFIKGEWIKKGAIVIDVGINRLPDGKICGDVEFEPASQRAAAISPVPGGVGPMTIAMLMKNTAEAAGSFAALRMT